MDLGLQGKAVLVTGASGGIGRAIANALGSAGAVPVLQARSRLAELEEWARGREWGARAHCVSADVRDPDALERALADAPPLFGCVVCAGIWPEAYAPLHAMGAGRARDVLETNLLGALWTSRTFLRGLQQGASRSGASLVFVGSTAALFGEAGHAAYAASKAGLVGLARSLKNEIVALDPGGRVNVVHPGWVVTEMTAAKLDEPGAIESVVRTMPLEQLATPGDIAHAVLTLLSPVLSRHVTGQEVTVAGGMEGRVLREATEVDTAAVRARSPVDADR